MALTKIGKEGITGISNSADATFLTATSGEGVTLAGTLAVTGVHTVGTNAVATSDGGAATTSIVQGLGKCWLQMSGFGSMSIGDSFNTTGITDNGTGNYTVTIANDMGNTFYSVSAVDFRDGTSGGNRDIQCVYNILVGAFSMTSVYDASVANDSATMFQVMGDLA